MFKNIPRRFIKEKEAKRLLVDFSQRISSDPRNLFGSKPRVEMAKINDLEIIFVDGKPLLAKSHDIFVPTLVFDSAITLFSKIVINMGAVPYVCNGADIMAPGVVRIEGDFKKDDFLLIIDERHGKSLGIGTALFDSQTMNSLNHGRIVRNHHFVGDKIWGLIRKVV